MGLDRALDRFGYSLVGELMITTYLKTKLNKNPKRQIYTVVFCPCCKSNHQVPGGFLAKIPTRVFCVTCINTKGKIAAWMKAQVDAEVTQ